MDEQRVARLHREANAGRWDLPREVFAEALARSVARAFGGQMPAPAELDRYLASLHVADLALACACVRGHEGAWDHFRAQFRPALDRAADAVALGGGAGDLADAIDAELSGREQADGERQSLLRHFHGRSSLGTWLRSLVAQRHVDWLREQRRLVLPEDAAAQALLARVAPPDPDRARLVSAMRVVLAAAVAALPSRERLRLACYYVHDMPLAQIGRLTSEHEATASRQLSRTRRAIRAAVEARLKADHHFNSAEITECFASLATEAEAADLAAWLSDGNSRKNARGLRSMQGNLS